MSGPARASGEAIVLHGVDFSGGENSAGKIWVASADGRDLSLRRGFDHHAIVELIARSAEDGRRHLWRIDAPFGLPIETLDAMGVERDWNAAVRWLESHGEARAWRSACRAVSRREPRRTTDRAAHTPMAPANLRVFKQTWTVIVRVLDPLARRGVRIEPLAGPPDSPIVVAEGCPASALHLRAWSMRGYKGRGDAPRARRAEIVQRLRDVGTPVPARVAEMAIDDVEGDGVDALLLLLPPAQTVVPAEGQVEGWVY